MQGARARSLLEAERAKIQRMLDELASTGREERGSEGETGDGVDSASTLAAEGVDDAVMAGLQEGLAAIERAEQRLRGGSFGFSIRSGTPIPDERLEVMPTAELTEEEASKQS